MRETAPISAFRFHVDFFEKPSAGGASPDAPVCSGAFSEISGLEATMEARAIREGGRNYGPVQRVGPVTFGTVILRRGVTSTRHLFRWFNLVATGASAYRMTVVINQFDVAGNAVVAWRLDNVLPVKFKAGDLNAKSSEVAVEELHVVHEGLSAEPVTTPQLQME